MNGNSNIGNLNSWKLEMKVTMGGGESNSIARRSTNGECSGGASILRSKELFVHYVTISYYI